LADEYTYELTEEPDVFRNRVCPSVILVNVIKTCKYGMTSLPDGFSGLVSCIGTETFGEFIMGEIIEGIYRVFGKALTEIAVYSLSIIATCYGPDGPGIESRWGARFSTPALGPAQPPIQWVPGLSRGAG
jgi:hypothetical protein